jgi:hypothetical protein
MCGFFTHDAPVSDVYQESLTPLYFFPKEPGPLGEKKKSTGRFIKQI